MKRVVLCRPEGPRNVGACLRLAQNFGPCELALVAPRRPSMLVHPEFEQMSHGAEGAREAILVFDELADALADCTASVGFTARVRGSRVRSEWSEARGRLEPVGDAPDQRLALVFGNEVEGLTRAEAALCQELTHVRTSAEHTSLNLAAAVAVVLAGLFTGRERHAREPGGSMLDGKGRAFLKARMQEVFAGRVALTPAAARDIASSIERVFSRAPLENRDARAWHLMLRALGSELAPPELGLELHARGGRRRRALSEKARTLQAPGEARTMSAEAMVRLNRIYTRTGDDGTTGLGDGTRLGKHHPRVASYGTVDETSCVIGLALAAGIDAPWDERLRSVQNDLFDVGSDLCLPGEVGERVRLSAVYVQRLEAWIDEVNQGLEPLKSFVLPGGSAASAWLHLARTTCRRAERLVVELAANEPEKERVNPEVVRYLNRLSDLLFVLARASNDAGRGDVLWEPGRGSR